MSFFVTGLPRSRTAWLANWLTTERTLCLHDVRFDKGKLGGERLVGFSGPELVPQFAAIEAVCPGAPWVCVLRDSAQALDAFKRFAFWTLPPAARGKVLESFWAARRKEIAELCLRPNVFSVAYGQLDEERTARGIWDHLLPGVPFDEDRWRLLKGFKVEQLVVS